MTKFLTAFFFLSYSTIALSTPQQLEDDFDTLKSIPNDYTVFGTICEQVAQLRMEEVYDHDDYEVVTGIVYENHSWTLGELDVVVFDRFTQKAIVIAEVKCWRNLNKAQRKAQRQLNRFKHAIRDGHKVNHIFEGDDRLHEFSREQFMDDPQYLTISQEGGKSCGFDMNLGLSLDEVKSLRNKLISCQRRGECATPEQRPFY